MMFRPRYASRDVREYQIVPTVFGHQSICRGEVDSDLPLFSRDELANVGLFCLLRSAHIYPFTPTVSGMFKISCQPELSTRNRCTRSSRSCRRLSLNSHL